VAKARVEKPRIVGRPTRLTEKVRDRLVELLEKGVYLSHAAPVVGVDRRTLCTWMQRGRDDLSKGLDTRHAALAQAVEDARSRGAAFMTELITSAARRDWKAAAWYLERTQPTLFGPVNGDTPARDEFIAQEDTAFESELDELNDGELELYEQMLNKAERLLSRGRKRRAG
jgi:hypothetical protein